MEQQTTSWQHGCRPDTGHWGMLRLPCLLLVLLLSGVLHAEDAASRTNTPAAPALSNNRFLFIVDTSASMEKHAVDAQKIVVDILSSQADGQLRPGDTIGAWTFNAGVYTGVFPLQTWSPERWREIAAHTAEFLQAQHYRGKSRFDLALADMFDIIKASDIITIVLISNGEGKMEGTPFDGEINTAYKQCLKEMKRDKKPVVTVLLARRGQVTHYTVNGFPWPVVIPAVPANPRVVKVPKPPAALAAPAPATNVSPETTAQKTGPVKIAPPLILSGPDTSPAPAQVEAKPTEIAANSNSVPANATELSAPATNKAAEAGAVSNAPPITITKSSERGEALEPAVPAAPPEKPGYSVFSRIAAICLLIIAIGLGVLIVRRFLNPQGPSLITISMTSRKK